MACTLGNKCAKNCCKRTLPVQLIVEDVVTCFFGTRRRKATRPKRKMPPPCLIYLRPRVTLNFDLLASKGPKLNVSRPCPELRTICANLDQNRFIRLQNIRFTSLELTTGRTERLSTGCACESGLTEP